MCFRKVHRRILIAVIMLIVLTCLSLTVSAEERAMVASGQCGENVTWTLDDRGLLTISGTGPMTEYDYPENVPWLSDYSTAIKTVVIESGVTSICTNAFHGCGALQSAVIPDSVTDIGYGAFSSCCALTEITLPEGITTISGGLFTQCTALENIAIPESVTAIGSNAFSRCESLQSIAIPGKVMEIEDNAFASCTSLKRVTFEEGVTTIGLLAFHKCVSLESITFPESLKSIGTSAFALCSALKNVNIPAGVNTIGSMAFYKCEAMEGILVDTENENFSSDASGVLFNKDKTKLLSAPGTLSGDYTIPETVTAMDSNAFSHCKNLHSVTIPQSVTKIPSSAFAYCSGLQSATIPDSVTELGMYAYYNCTSLKYVVIGSGVKKLDEKAFAENTGLREIHFKGDAPTVPMYYGTCNVFTNVTANAYYPADNSTWTASKCRSYGGNITWVAVETPALSGFGVSLVLNETIDMNLIPQDGVTLEGNVVSLTYADGSEAEYTIVNVQGQPAVRHSFNADRMNETVTLQIFDAQGNPLTKELTISVRDYAAKLLSVSQSDVEKGMMIRLLDYGALAQLYSAQQTDTTVAAADLANSVVTDAQRSFMDGYNMGTPESYTPVVTPSGGAFSASLTLNESVDMNIYIDPVKIGENEKLIVKLGGEVLPEGEYQQGITNGGKISIRYSFHADCMNEELTVAIADKNTGAVRLSLDLSIRKYAHIALANYSSDRTLCAMLVAMLDYGALAQQYGGNNVDDLANRYISANQRAVLTGYDWPET